MTIHQKQFSYPHIIFITRIGVVVVVAVSVAVCTAPYGLIVKRVKIDVSDISF